LRVETPTQAAHTTKEEEQYGTRKSGRPGQPRYRATAGLPAGGELPRGKEEVASNAEGNNAPQELVEQIRNSGTENFNSADEVLQKVQGGQ
jgi:hypothetical protein